MKRPHASDDVRARALAAVDAGHRVADVAAMFQNDPSTIRRWLRQRERTGSGLSRPRSGRGRLLDADDEIALAKHLSSHPDASLAERVAWLRAERGIAISPSTVRRAIVRLRRSGEYET